MEKEEYERKDSRVRALYEWQEKNAALSHAAALLEYDGATGAPAGTDGNRARTEAYLAGEMYRLGADSSFRALLSELEKDPSGLSEAERRMVVLLGKEARQMEKIPKEEYVAYRTLKVRSSAAWHRAKESSDFSLFRPYLEQVFAYERRFASYLEPDKDPYGHCLENFEEGLSVGTLDRFFARLRDGIVPLIREISKKAPLDDSLRHGQFPKEAQRGLALDVMRVMGLDSGHVGLSETEHPFTTSLGSHLDTRITTHYYPGDFACSLFSVMHEGGHALYETGVDEAYLYTVLDGGAAMSIHESQSRFYENRLGRSRAFCRYLFPVLCKWFPEQMKGKTDEELYRAVNKVQPSFIRTEADELTYCMHVMVRYELERRVFEGDLAPSELPAAWNDLYAKYLGIVPPNDRLGVLQDSHWSSGLVGYFPSYALGNAYGAQFCAVMQKEVDVDGCMEKGDFSPVNAWNREHIWKYGRLYSPSELFEKVTGEAFDPCYYVEYLQKKYSELYGL